MARLYKFIFWISTLHIATQNSETKLSNYRFKFRADDRNNSNSGDAASNFIFPGQHTKLNSSFVPDITENCENLGICEDIPNYPEHQVEKLLNQEKLKSTKFNVDVLVPHFEQRLGPEEDYLELCRSTLKLITPRAAKDINNKWHFIVNREKEPQQTFRVETCVKQNSHCSTVAYFAQGYEGRCIQKYVLRIMTAIDMYGNITEKPFRVPSCCSCVYKVNSIYK